MDEPWDVPLCPRCFFSRESPGDSQAAPALFMGSEKPCRNDTILFLEICIEKRRADPVWLVPFFTKKNFHVAADHWEDNETGAGFAEWFPVQPGVKSSRCLWTEIPEAGGSKGLCRPLFFYGGRAARTKAGGRRPAGSRRGKKHAKMGETAVRLL